MAHRRPPLLRALQLNTTVLVLEIAGAIGAGSLSLVMDGVHNLSDELALALLVAAYTVRRGLSGRFLRLANILNSIGLMVISALLVWQALERFSDPRPILGSVPIIVGLLSAAGNWMVARTLRWPGKEDVAIRIAYVHNLGDTLISLTPVGAGAMVVITGSSVYDALVAAALGGVIVLGALRTLVSSGREVMWPEVVTCGPPRRADAASGHPS